MSAPLGVAWVSDFGWITHLDYVLVRDEFRRGGVATALVAACRERWPNLQGLGIGDAISEAGRGFAVNYTQQEG